MRDLYLIIISPKTLIFSSLYLSTDRLCRHRAGENRRGFALVLEPENPDVWETWRPQYDTQVVFVAKLLGSDPGPSLYQSDPTRQ